MLFKIDRDKYLMRFGQDSGGFVLNHFFFCN